MGYTTTVANPSGATVYNQTTLNYYSLNLLSSLTDPLGNQTSYVYMPAGRLQEIDRPNTQKVSYGYDKADRLNDIQFNGTDKYQLGYDNATNLTSVKDVEYAVDLDIMSFFDEIPYELLMEKVHERITDGKVLTLIRGWLTAGFMEDGQFHETEIGSPQGGNLSPLLANLYLNHFDWGMKKKGFAVVRYADDGAPRMHGA